MKTERPSRPGKPGRSDKTEKPVRSARPRRDGEAERSPVRKRTSKPDADAEPKRTFRPGKSTSTERHDKPERAGKPEKYERSERPARPLRPEKTERTGRPEKYEKTERPARPLRPEKTERTGRPERTERTERSGRPERSERSDRPERPGKFVKPGRTGRPERTYKLDRSSLPDREVKPKKVVRKGEKNDNPDLLRLNKYIANSGICSRREADRMIEAGAVSVNGEIVTQLGIKVGPGDKVQYGDQTINREKPRYVLLNKPKGYITTVDDPEKRKTVMALVAGACKERIYPVGRLDRNTTGLLLFTNDGNIAKKLTHPRYGIKKIYHVEIEKNLTRVDFLKITEGFKLEEEFIKVDSIEYIGDGKDKKQIGIELHSGQNRIVRRIFEHFDYKVLKLDRVYYAGLTKKNLPRGTWRLLDEQEINLLKMISSKP
jgi:23S rRNA pseudouridine2605 synthase